MVKSIKEDIQIIQPLMGHLNLKSGDFIPRDGIQGPPDPSDIIILQLILHFPLIAAFTLPDPLPQLPLHNFQFLFIT